MWLNAIAMHEGMIFQCMHSVVWVRCAVWCGSNTEYRNTSKKEVRGPGRCPASPLCLLLVGRLLLTTTQTIFLEFEKCLLVGIIHPDS